MNEALPYRTTAINGIELNYIDAGEGPAVLLLHGFPDIAYTWRHQIGPLTTAGFRVIAPDMRGCGGTTVSGDVAAYTYMHIIGDLTGLMDELGIADAAVVGHDMGGYVAWNMALIVPDRVRAVVGMSVALRARPSVSPLTALGRALGPGFYQLRFQVPDGPDSDLQDHVENFLPGILVGLSADAPEPVTSLVLGDGQVFSDLFPAPASLPAWLTAADCQRYVQAYEKTGFFGGLASYRNLDRNWQLTAPWNRARVTQPAMYIAGRQDIAYAIAVQSGALTEMETTVPGMRRTVVLEDCGHWISQEQPEAFNAELLSFLT
jgi:pimeloyl-ACP methyl ester carboxylesterase